jgi:talin
MQKDNNLNFDEQILEAARSITNAASALIKAATLAQKEITIHGKVFNSFSPVETPINYTYKY